MTIEKVLTKKDQKREEVQNSHDDKNTSIQLLTLILPLLTIILYSTSNLDRTGPVSIGKSDEELCYNSCRVRIVETIPENVTFSTGPIPPSTHFAWTRLIDISEKNMYIAAYKSSLQGKHVLGNLSDVYSKEGNEIFSAFLKTGRMGEVTINMIENYPPKDKGDNADGVILQNYGAVKRRSLDVEKILGRGKMHSKFLLADERHFYLGSANLDWRSLNQKMELGMLVENCDCLGRDLKNVFYTYWNLSPETKDTSNLIPAYYNMQNPLKIKIGEESSEIYIATSPKQLNHKDRTWDLDAIVAEIDNAREFLDVHVMDYFPLFLYKKPRLHFPIIDDALRRAIVRGTKVRILAAALHYPEICTRFLRSLQSLSNMNENTSVQVKIFKVPTLTENVVINRERRTHNKFMVSETAVVVGTSNWSGDYFVGGTTGAAIVVKQNGHKKSMIREMQEIFQRNWESPYAHNLDEYYTKCVLSSTAEFCETKKDPSLLAKKPS